MIIPLIDYIRCASCTDLEEKMIFAVVVVRLSFSLLAQLVECLKVNNPERAVKRCWYKCVIKNAR